MFRAARCPSCHKDIQVPDDASNALCMFCGQSVPLNTQPSLNSPPNIANLLGMARTADAANNMEEAGSYYNRVLEIDPTVSEAWFGKGRCAGWQSSMAAMRFTEMQVAFGHAIGTSGSSEKGATVQKCVYEINRLVATLYGISRKHLDEYASLPKTWVSYLEQTAQMLNALDVARQWAPLDRTTLENIVHLSKDNIEGITYRDKFDNNNPKGQHLSPEYEQQIRQKLQTAADSLKQIDPNYVAPTPQVKKPDACFVITATMGDFDHPNVVFMRRFRDDWILKKAAGERFVDWYYRHAPSAARFISKSPLRRSVSYYCIVVPAAWVARKLLER
jgi:hypothetical protein